MAIVENDVRDELVALLPRLRRFACALTKSIDDADDLVQAACERALTRLHQWQRGSRLDSWMFRIVQTIWIDRMRAKRVRGTETDAGAADLIAGSHGERDMEARSALRRTREAMSRLAPEQRLVLALVSIEGLSYKEAAEVLDVPIGTVMSRLARARRRLHAMVYGASDDETANPGKREQAYGEQQTE